MEAGLQPVVPVLIWWLACGGLGPIEPHPAVLTPSWAAPVSTTFALVGATDVPPPTGLVPDVARVAEQVVLVGDAVRVGGAEGWDRVGARWRSMPTLPLRGAGERRVDPRGRRFGSLFPEATPWGRVDVGPHRIVWLEPDDPVDQRFWLPGALAQPDGGVVVLLPEAAAEVEQQVLEAVPPSALAMLVRGGAAGNRARLPYGRWGPLEVSVGPVEGGGSSPSGEGRASTPRTGRCWPTSCQRRPGPSSPTRPSEARSAPEVGGLCTSNQTG